VPALVETDPLGFVVMLGALAEQVVVDVI